MAATRTRYLAGISKNTVLWALAGLFADISSEMLYPILPIFLTQTPHATGSVVGLVEGIAEATQSVVQGFSGWLSDRLQKRKSLALAGYLVSALDKPLMGVARAWSGVLGGRFLDRLAGEPMAELCREFGISRKTGYKIFDRYQETGIHGLTDRNRPHFHDKIIVVTNCGRIVWQQED